jgi:hypothetical protein
MTEDEQRRLIWLAVIERIRDLSTALHTTLDAVRDFPATDQETMAVDRALDHLDAAVGRYQDNMVPRLVASGWPTKTRHVG